MNKKMLIDDTAQAADTLDTQPENCAAQLARIADALERIADALDPDGKSGYNVPSALSAIARKL